MVEPIRKQSSLGTEFRRAYNEGQNIDRIMLATVLQVNYRYNTVDIKLRDNTIIARSGADEGRFSARLPVEFAGRTTSGKPFGQIQPIAVGTVVLVGFEEGDKSKPIVLAVVNSADSAKELSRAPFSGAAANNEALLKHMNHKFTVHPSLTYDSIDGTGNRTTSFNGKSFMIMDSDGKPKIQGVSDDLTGTAYESLPTSHYFSGELIEPINEVAPTILFKHQGKVQTANGVEDSSQVFMAFLNQDGTFRLSTLKSDEDWRSFFSISPNGNIILKHQRDTKALNGSGDNVSITVGDKGIELRAGKKYLLLGDEGFDTNTGLGLTSGISQEDLDKIGELVDGLDERILSMGTSITKTAEEIKLSAYQNVALENAFKAYQADFSVMARQIYSSVSSTEVSGSVSESLQSLSAQILEASAKAEKAMATITAAAANPELSVLEKQAVNDLWLEIKAEYPGYLAQLDDAQVPASTYIVAYTGLLNYLPALLADSKNAATIDPVAFEQAFSAYYMARNSALQSVYTKFNTAIEDLTNAAIEAAGASGEAMVRVSEARIAAMRLTAAATQLASDGKLSPAEKLIVQVFYADIEAAHAESVEVGTAYGVATASLVAAKTTLDTLAQGLFSNLNEETTVTAATITNTFTAYYDALATLYQEVTEAAAVILDGYNGDVKDYSSKIVQTDKRIAAIVTSTELIGTRVALNQAMLAIQADKISSSVTETTLNRDFQAIMDTLNSGGRNWFSQETATSGTLDQDGQLANPVDGSKVSEWILVPTDTNFTSTLFNNEGNNVIQMAWYDPTRTFLETAQVSGTTTEITLTAKSPSNAKYLRVTALRLPESKLQIEVGSSATAYKLSAVDTVANVVLAKEEVALRQADSDAKTLWAQEAKANSLADTGVITGLVTDGTLTPEEKTVFKPIWDALQAEYPDVIDAAQTYFVNSNTLVGYYASLSSVLTPLFTNMAAPSAVSSTTLLATLQNYYDARQLILDKIKDYAEKALATAKVNLTSATASALEAERVKDELVAKAETAARNIKLMGSMITAALEYKTTALDKVTQMSLDNSISPIEKVTIQSLLTDIDNEYDWHITQANIYSLSTATFSGTKAALAAYLAPMITIDNLTEVTPVAAATFLATFNSYYTAKELLLNNVLAGAQGSYAALEAQAQEAIAQANRKDEEYINYLNIVNDTQGRVDDISADINDLKDSVPYILELSSSLGTAITSDTPETILTATLYRGNVNITDQIPENYISWSKLAADGTVDTSWVPAYLTVGDASAVKVTHTEISKKANYLVEVFEDVDSVKTSRGSAQITILDVTDGKQLTAYLRPSQQRQVVYNPDTNAYTPSYSADPMTLTPYLQVPGSEDNKVLVSNVTWSYRANSTGDDVPITLATSGHMVDVDTKELMISTNVLQNNLSMQYICTINYLDADGTPYQLVTDIELLKVTSGSSSIVPLINTPDGVIVRNGQNTLRAEIELYQGGQPISANSYRWYWRDLAGLGDQYSGPGWVQLTDAAPKDTSGYFSDALVITPGAVLGAETFLCVATYNGQDYRATITVTDLTDPYSFVILGVDTFKNGQGTNPYTCKVYQRGLELDAVAPHTFTYNWSMYRADGTPDPTFAKTGKTISVSAAEFTYQGVLECQVYN